MFRKKAYSISKLKLSRVGGSREKRGQGRHEEDQRRGLALPPSQPSPLPLSPQSQHLGHNRERRDTKVSIEYENEVFKRNRILGWVFSAAVIPGAVFWIKWKTKPPAWNEGTGYMRVLKTRMKRGPALKARGTARGTEDPPSGQSLQDSKQN